MYVWTPLPPALSASAFRPTVDSAISVLRPRARNVQLARTLPQSPDSVQTYPRGAILAQKQTAKAADCHCHQASQRPSGSEVDLRQHLLAIWRIRWFTLAVAVGIGLAVYALQSFAPAKYRGDLTLSLQLPSSQGADPKPQADYSAQALVALANTSVVPVSYTHLRAHETDSYLVCRLLLE